MLASIPVCHPPRQIAVELYAPRLPGVGLFFLVGGPVGPRRRREFCLSVAFGQRPNVSGLEYSLFIPAPDRIQHRPSHLFRGQIWLGTGLSVVGRSGPVRCRAPGTTGSWIESRAAAGSRQAGTRRRRERESQHRVFGLSFDARPHDPAVFGAVGTLAGDVDERHRRVQTAERFSGGQRDSVGDPLVVGLRHPVGGDPKQ